MKKIGIYGGTFDPIHFGHLNLAFELMEKGNLNEIWFVPAQVNPHKLNDRPTPFIHRLAMLERAVKEIPCFLVKDLEGKRAPPSYTLHTLQLLKEENPQDQFYLLLGEDSIPGFFHWYQPQEILKIASVLIGSRVGHWQFQQYPSYPLEIREAIEQGLIQTRLMDISGTQIRERMARNLYCGYLAPDKVLEYIKENHLYKSNY
jgi:nicotinate-nucleotide adenylyltransferase